MMWIKGHLYIHIFKKCDLRKQQVFWKSHGAMFTLFDLFQYMYIVYLIQEDIKIHYSNINVFLTYT